MEIRENVILAPYTTFRIGGPARFFCEVESREDLKSALKFSKEKNLQVFVLGGGSNILVSDKGFSGLVVKMGIKGLEFKDEKDFSILTAGAGENWDNLVAETVGRNLGGLENLSLIPGTVGGAVCQNIGAYGTELKDVLESVEALDVGSGEIKTFSNSGCEFGYRESVFKKREGLVVLRASIKLSKNPKPNINYPDLAKRFERKMPFLAEIRNAVIEIRRNKLPYPSKVGNAGSFFKNPTIEISNFKLLISKHPDLKGFKQDNGLVKLSSAQLIEKCGWKGKRHGNVGISDQHSLVLVNHGGGKAEEIVSLAEDIKNHINNAFGVNIEPEVLILSHF